MIQCEICREDKKVKPNMYSPTRIIYPRSSYDGIPRHIRRSLRIEVLVFLRDVAAASYLLRKVREQN